MPFTGTANWNAATADPSKHAVYIVRFEGLDSVQFSTGPVASASRTTKPYVSSLSGFSQSVDPKDGRVSAGDIFFVLTDKESEITGYLASGVYANQRVTILAGYAGLAESDYASIGGEGFLVSIETGPGLASYRLRTGDPKRAELEDVFTNAYAGAGGGVKVEGYLTAGEAAGGDRLDFKASDVYETSGGSRLQQNDTVFLRNAAGQEERVTVRKVASSWFRTTEPIRYAYATGDLYRWGSTLIRGNPIDIYYAILTGCFARSSSAVVATTLDAEAAAGQRVVPLTSTTGVVVGDGYFIRDAAGEVEEVVVVESIDAGVSITARDNLVNTFAAADNFVSSAFRLDSFAGLPTGLRVPTWKIDATGLAAERDDFLPLLVMDFEIRERVRARDFAQTELLRMFGYPVVTPEGLLGFHAYAPRRAGSTALALTEDDVYDVEWSRRWDIAYNRLTVRYDYRAEHDKFLVEQTYNDAATQALVGIREIVVELRGLKPELLNASYVDDYAARFLRRYAAGAVELRLGAHFSKRGAALGEGLDFSHPSVPNVRTGARGLPVRSGSTPAPCYDVVKVEQALTDRPSLSLVLQEDGFTRPGFIAPDGQDDYDVATPGERLYAYVSPASGANFSDGTEPYKVI